jgi:hypothetical protein
MPWGFQGVFYPQQVFATQPGQLQESALQIRVKQWNQHGFLVRCSVCEAIAAAVGVSLDCYLEGTTE